MSSKKKKRPATESGGLGDLRKLTAGELGADHFCSVWNRSETLKEVAKVTGLAASTCANYAARLREFGRELKTFARGRPRLLKM